MSKYVFKKLKDDKSNSFYGTPDLTEIKISTDHDSLPELLEVFKNFLSACGYVIPVGSELELIEEDSYEVSDNDTRCCSVDRVREDIQAEEEQSISFKLNTEV